MGREKGPELAGELRPGQDGGMSMDKSADPDEISADDPASRVSVTLLAGQHRRAEGGHPWIYSNEVQMDAAAKALDPGTLVTLRRADGRALGSGCSTRIASSPRASST